MSNKSVGSTFEYKHSRYAIKAKRVGETAWTEWTMADTLERAEYHAAKIRALGFKAKIIDRSLNNG